MRGAHARRIFTTAAAAAILALLTYTGFAGIPPPLLAVPISTTRDTKAQPAARGPASDARRPSRASSAPRAEAPPTADPTTQATVPRRRWHSLASLDNIPTSTHSSALFNHAHTHSRSQTSPNPRTDPTEAGGQRAEERRWVTCDYTALPVPAAWTNGTCEIDRVPLEEMTATRFRAEYLEQRPVVLVGVSGAAASARLRAAWTAAGLVRAAGAARVETVTEAGPDARAGESSHVRMPFHTFLRAHLSPCADLERWRRFTTEGLGIPYAFSRVGVHFFEDRLAALPWSLRRLARRLGIQVKDVEAEPAGQVTDAFLTVGSPLTGLAFHTHRGAITEAVYGRKVWYLAGPRCAALNGLDGRSLGAFVRDGPPAEGRGCWPVVCVQRPGEVVYVPRWWQHGTVNLDDFAGATLHYEDTFSAAQWEALDLFV